MRYSLRNRMTGAIASLALVLAAQGCLNTTLPTVPTTYPGPEEYANYGYADDSLIYAAYDPFVYGYWCLPPYYYYWYVPPYDRDCHGGYCGPRGGRKPLRPVYPWPLVAAHAPANQVTNPAKATVAATLADTHVPVQPTISLNGDEPSANGHHEEGSMTHGISDGGFHGVGLGGFGGGGRGSFHR